MTQNEWLGQSHEELANRGHVKAIFPSNFNSGFSYDVLHSLLNCWPLHMIPPVVMGNIFILQLVIIGIASSGSWRFVAIAGWNWLKRKCYTKDILVTALVATRLPWFPVVFSCLSANRKWRGFILKNKSCTFLTMKFHCSSEGSWTVFVEKSISSTSIC